MFLTKQDITRVEKRLSHFMSLLKQEVTATQVSDFATCLKPCL